MHPNVLLPGVGSFPQAMKNLKLKLVDTIYDFYKSKKLIVGICLTSCNYFSGKV